MVNESKKTGRKRKVYSAEFKAEAVRMAVSKERKYSEVCRNLGITQTSLSKWIRLSKGEVTRQEPCISELIAENKKLSEELRKVRLEQEILKKAVAYFAKNLV
jgi:transposase